MARHTPLPRFQLDTDSDMEETPPGVPSTSRSSSLPQPHKQSPLQTPRSQIRVRRSACSDLQSTTIPEGRVYNGSLRRASLFVGRSSPPKVDLPIVLSCNREPTECDYVNLCREKCRSLYGSLADPTVELSSTDSTRLPSASFAESDDDDEDEDDDDDDDTHDEPCFVAPPVTSFRHSLPDTLPASLIIRNFLRRHKTANDHHHHRLGLPAHSSHSLCSSTSSSSSMLTNSSSALSTFRNFLSLVKLPSSSSKSINTSPTSSTVHHSSLTTLAGASSVLSPSLDQNTTTSILSKKRPTTGIDTQYRWYFQVSTSTH